MSEINNTTTTTTETKIKKERATLKKALTPYFEKFESMTSKFSEEKFRAKNKQVAEIMGEENFNKLVEEARAKYQKDVPEEEITKLYALIGFEACKWYNEQQPDEK